MRPFGLGEKKNKPDLENLQGKVDQLLQLFRKQLEMSVETQSALLQFLKNPDSWASACESSNEEKAYGYPHEESRAARDSFSKDSGGLEEIDKLRKQLAAAQDELAKSQLDLKNEKARQSTLQSEIDSLESENQSLRIDRAKEAEARQKSESDARDCRNRLEDALNKLGEAERREANAGTQLKLAEEKLIISEDSQKRAKFSGTLDQGILQAANFLGRSQMRPSGQKRHPGCGMKYWITTFQMTGIALFVGAMVAETSIPLGVFWGIWLIFIGFIFHSLIGGNNECGKYHWYFNDYKCPFCLCCL